MQAIYMHMDHIKGDSTVAHHKHAIELLSFEHGVDMPMSLGEASSGALKAGRSNHKDMVVTKLMDGATPHLYQHCVDGTVHKKITVSLWANDGKNHVEYFKYELHHAVITSMTVRGGGEDLPVETLTIFYQKIELTHKHLKPHGGAGGNKAASHDRQTGKSKS